MHGLGQALFLALAGLVAGVIGTAGGITSLVAYPALLVAGVPPLAANVTSSVALIGSGASSALRAGSDLAGHARTVRALLPPLLLGSAAGAALLVVTPTAVFDRVVPFLVAAGSTILLLQPRITRRMERRGTELGRAAEAVSAGGVGLYNGYFGAGAGILTIALLLFGREPDLRRANAVKNLLVVLSDLLPAVLFAITATVVWGAAVPLGVGAIAGGLIGPSVARRVRPDVLRVLIAICGFALAAWLLVSV